MKEKNENKTRGNIDPALVAKAKAGDQSAVTALYEQTYTGLYRSIRSMVHDEDLAWDILQDSYLKAFQNLDKLEANGAFLSWLRRIAVNETARQMSKRLPTTFTELSGDGEDDAMPELPDLNPDNQPELVLDRQETSRLVREILAELPEQQQLVIGMHYYEDMDTKEIAELLHLAPSTVRVQLHAGRKKVEAKVRALEQQGLKLYGLAPFPFLLALLRRMEPAEAAEQKALAAILSQAPATGSAAAAAGTQAVKVTAMTAGQAIRHGLAAKLAAGALAVCMIGGGIFAGAKLLENKQPDRGDVQPTEPAVSSYEMRNGTGEETPSTISEETELSTNPVEVTEPQDTAETAETGAQTGTGSEESYYESVLDQYRRALADPNFTAENYPLVNAETVSNLAMRWSKYPTDDGLYHDPNDEGLFAIYHDIDGNGTQELIITGPGPGMKSNDSVYNRISAVYAWNGSEAVELLGKIGFQKGDSVTIYEDGLIRCVENGYYTSPAQVTDYRLDAEQAVLRAEREFTYLCTEQGERSFRTADETLLTPMEFYADCGKSISLDQWYWDEEAQESREQGFYVASNPGTAKDAPVTRWEDISAEMAEERALPRITLEGEVFENFNREIQQKYLTEGGEGYDSQLVYYSWSLNDDVLCIYLYTAGGGVVPIDFRRFSVSEARELTEDELLERCGMTRAAFEAGLIPGVNAAFGEEFDQYLYVEYRDDSDYDRFREMHSTVSPWVGDDNLSGLVLDRNGDLAYLVLLPSVVGGDSYYMLVPVQW